tara:strand:- start:4018 stop:4701 length:684 start_codon:yes stop_codon:yes gene_type:complete
MGKYPYFPKVKTEWSKQQTFDGITIKEVTTPSINPPANYMKLYFKSDGKLYKLNSSGVETVSNATVSSITQSLLDAKSNIASPTFTGTVVLPNVPAIVQTAINTKTETIPIALGDESTVLATASTSVPVVTYNIPYAFTVTNVIISATVAGTGGSLVTVDVHDDGTTILSTKVTLDAGEKTSATASTQPVVSSGAIGANSLIEIFVDGVDSNNLCAGLKVWLVGYQT